MGKLTKEQSDFVARFLHGKTPERADRGKVLSPEEMVALHREATEQAEKVIEKARRQDKATTAAVIEFAKQSDGKLTGLTHRVKEAESLADGILDESVSTGKSPEVVAKGVTDALRYTTVYEVNRYVNGVKADRARLKKDGYEEKSFKNFWKNKTGYLGINAVYINPKGVTFEMQFHTPASFHAKHAQTHDLYKQMTGLDVASDEYQDLEDQQQVFFDKVERPKGAEDLRKG